MVGPGKLSFTAKMLFVAHSFVKFVSLSCKHKNPVIYNDHQLLLILETNKNNELNEILKRIVCTYNKVVVMHVVLSHAKEQYFTKNQKPQKH